MTYHRDKGNSAG